MSIESVEYLAKAIESFGTSIAWFGFWIGAGLAIIGIGIAIQNQ